jgi:hypothetical protein
MQLPNTSGRHIQWNIIHTYLHVYLYKVVPIYSITYILGHMITCEIIYAFVVVSVLFISLYLVSKQIWFLYLRSRSKLQRSLCNYQIHPVVIYSETYVIRHQITITTVCGVYDRWSQVEMQPSAITLTCSYLVFLVSNLLSCYYTLQ